MSFATLTLPAEHQSLLSDLKTALEQPGYRHPVNGGTPQPDQVFENVDSDPQIPDTASSATLASRQGLLDTLVAHGPSTLDEFREHFIRFCRGQARQGAVVDAARTRRLGHVHQLDRLAAWLRDPASPLGVGETRAWLRDLVRTPGTALDRLALQQAAIAKDTLSPHDQWSFLDDADDDPFKSLPKRRPDVVNRLGLGHVVDPTIELVGWTHHLPPDITPHRPTAWDATLFPCGRPHGRTEPLDGSGGYNGLAEVVHRPIGADHLATPIEAVAP